MTDAPLLPGADRAVVPREKLEGYLLNERHAVGRHKARVFEAALGIRQGDWEYLHDQLRAGITSAAVTVEHETRWGRVYEAIVPVAGLNGETRRVMTVWLVAAEAEPPRFVTGYVVGEPPSA